MTSGSNPSETSERVERLLTELAESAPATHQLAEEAIGLVVELYGAALGRIVDYAGPAITTSGEREGRAGAPTTLDHLLADDLVASLLVLHDLHPLDTTTRIHQAMERVRPYMGTHLGDVEVVEVDLDHGVAVLRLRGNCDSCPSASATLAKTIEQLVTEAAPEIEEVRIEGADSEEPDAPNPERIRIDAEPRRPPEHAMDCAVPTRLVRLAQAGDRQAV